MFSLHFRQWSVKLSLFSPTITRQSSNNRTTRAPARRKKGRKRGHPIFGATGHLRFQYGLLKWENNLNNFYNFEQRFAGTLSFRGPCRSRLACCETTKHNASPWTHFLLISPGVMSPRRFHSWNPCCILLFPLQQDCNTRSVQSCKLVVNVVFCCFPLFSRICPREGSIHGTRVVFCCLPLQQDCNTRSVKSCNLL